MTIYFDMDGTIADLYKINNWLNYLIKEDTFPYENALPMIEKKEFQNCIKKLQKNGYNFGIISWTSKNGSKSYNNAVRKIKKEWINKHYPNIFSEIHIIKYGTPKYKVAKDQNGILFDDEKNNRIQWKGQSFTEKNIIKTLSILGR